MKTPNSRKVLYRTELSRENIHLKVERTCFEWCWRSSFFSCRHCLWTHRVSDVRSSSIDPIVSRWNWFSWTLFPFSRQFLYACTEFSWRSLLLEHNTASRYQVMRSKNQSIRKQTNRSFRLYREGRPGIGLRLLVTVLDTSTCSPLANAVVDLWHCDAQGIYSHFVAASLGQNNAQTDNSTFFRGSFDCFTLISIVSLGQVNRWQMNKAKSHSTPYFRDGILVEQFIITSKFMLVPVWLTSMVLLLRKVDTFHMSDNFISTTA